MTAPWISGEVQCMEARLMADWDRMTVHPFQRAAGPVFTWLTGWPGIVVLGVGVAGLLLATWLGWRRTDLPYVPASALLSPAERAFFLVLRRAVAEDYELFAKVRLGDILQVKRGVEGKRRYVAFGQISSKHADFVACDPRTFEVVGVVELDDRSHDRPERQRRDAFFDAAMKVARVPVLRVPVRKAYSVKEVREWVREAFEEAT